MTNSVSCPVSGERINENAARIAAGYTVIITAIAVLFQWHWIMAVIAADFALRAFTPGTWSPLRWLAKNTSRLLNLQSIPVDASPKKFAAGLGMVFSASIFFTGMMHLTIVQYTIASMLVGCAILESAFAFCLGCVIYTSLIRIIPQKETTVQLPNSKTG